jgi:hypothetical protein
MKKLVFLLFVPFLWAQEKVDLSVINRIKAEAFQNSKVMETSFYFTDVYGPRLTGSPGLKAAADWAVKRMTEWGLQNAKLEPWGPFGRGWANVKFAAHMKEPQYMPIIGVVRPWSPGTNGAVSGEPMLAVVRTDQDIEKFKGKLKGKIVLLEDPRALAPITEDLTRRFSETELAAEAIAPDPSPRSPFAMPIPRSPGIPGMPEMPQQTPGQPVDMNAMRDRMRQMRAKINKFLTDEGVLVTVIPSFRTDGGTVFSRAAGSEDPKEPLPPPSVSVTSEHYNRIVRLLEKKIPVTLEFDIQNKFYEDTLDSFSVVGEIPGTSKADEVVLLGGHLDSWTFGTGATDNASGCAAVMEAARILKALGLQMARTVRVGLWTAEEQGLYGSRAYVKAHYADRDTMQLKPEHAKLSGYFNLDNGTGKIRGVYLQNNDMMRPIFSAWLEPFRDYGATTITIRNTSGTDHLAFDAVGLPGFQFIQDPVEYSTRTHHSNMDTFDRLQAGDLMEASAIIAAVAYHAASRPEMLPRKPLPKPGQQRRGGMF